ncbi:sulfotransferase 1B1-like [Glandiceps talaboti]
MAEKAYKDRNLTPGRCDTYVYERTGVEVPWFVTEECLDAMVTFDVRPSDVFLITAAKSGTTWMKHIISLVMNNANEDALEATSTSAFSPFINYPEFHVDEDGEPGYKEIARTECQRFIPTHLSPDLLPPQVFEKKPKVIYVARNPKDVAVSLYHHYLQIPFYCTYTWEEYLNNYIQGKETVYGEWGNHVIPWWEKRNEKNVFFVKYEDMIRDLGKCVRELATFLEQDHLTEDQLIKVTNLCTFESMKESSTALKIGFCDMWNIDRSKSPFVRKGKVGGWKNYFTVAQNEEFDEVYKKWIGDSGLEMDFTL